MASLNLGLLQVEREGRGATDSRTAVERVARLLRETRGFPGKVRLVARLGQITFRAMGQMVVPANKSHPYAAMESILRDRCTPRFVTMYAPALVLAVRRSLLNSTSSRGSVQNE
jgi:hypothetical protein